MSLETPNFVGDFHIFIGDPRFSLETSRFTLDNPRIFGRPQDFHWRPPDFYWRPQIFTGDPKLGFKKKWGLKSSTIKSFESPMKIGDLKRKVWDPNENIESQKKSLGLH